MHSLMITSGNYREAPWSAIARGEKGALEWTELSTLSGPGQNTSAPCCYWGLTIDLLWYKQNSHLTLKIFHDSHETTLNAFNLVSSLLPGCIQQQSHIIYSINVTWIRVWFVGPVHGNSSPGPQYEVTDSNVKQKRKTKARENLNHHTNIPTSALNSPSSLLYLSKIISLYSFIQSDMHLLLRVVRTQDCFKLGFPS